MATSNYISNNQAVDMTGKRYNHLLVLKRVESSKNGFARWECLCDCGSIKVFVGANVRSGRSKSCGCLQKKRTNEAAVLRRKVLDGKRFNMLTAISRDNKSAKKDYRTICRCDCGVVKSFPTNDLIRGKLKSCGCSTGLFISAALTKSKEHHKQKRHAKYLAIKNNPVQLATMRVRSCIASAFRYEGVKKKSKSSEILGCTYSQLKEHIEKQFHSGMSWDRFDEIHIDHIIPMAAAKNEDDVIRLNHFTNLRPMWAKDNMLKGDKLLYLI